MAKVSELMSNNIEWMKINKQTWSIFYNMKEYGAKGDGVTDDLVTLQAIINKLNGEDGVIIFPKGDYRIASNIIIPSNVFLYFVGEGFLVPDNGVTITINGGIIAGPYQIFKGEGNCDGSHVIVDQFYTEWWGAKGDGVTDDTLAITKTVSMANNATIIFFNKTYLVTNPSLLNPLNSTVYKAEGTLSRFLYSGQYYPIPLGTSLFSNGDNKVTVSIGGNIKTIELTGTDLVSMRDEFATFDARLDTLMQGGSPDKDLELVDIRTPVMGYVPDDTINVAGDMTRDMQSKMLTIMSNEERPLIGRYKTVKIDDVYNCWPVLVQTTTNRLITFYASGPSHKANGNREVAGRMVNYKYSDNDGLSWSDEITLKYAPDQDNVVFSAVALSNGNIICIVSENTVEDTVTVAQDSVVMLSIDDGVTFAEVFRFSNSTDENVNSGSYPNIPVEMDNGEVLAFKQVRISGQVGIAVIFSYDYGLTWNDSEIVIPITNANFNTIPWEIRVAYIGEGKLVAIGRNEQLGGSLYQLNSSDYGRTWTQFTTNINDCRANCAFPFYLSEDDTLTLYYTDRLSNTLKKRTVSASFIFENPTLWTDFEIIDYTSSRATGRDSGYTSAVRLRDGRREVAVALYTTRDMAVGVDDPKGAGIVLVYDTIQDAKTNHINDNLFTNGRFQVWQHGTSGLTPTSEVPMYTASLWGFMGIGSFIVGRGTSGLFNKYTLAINATNSTSYYRLYQPIIGLTNGVYTLTTVLNTNFNCNIKLYVKWTESSVVKESVVLAKEVNVNSATRTLSFTFRLPSVDFGTPVYIGLQFEGKGSLTLYDMKVEKGYTFTGISEANQVDELNKCLTYYEEMTGTMSFSARNDGSLMHTLYFSTKRATPNVNLYWQNVEQKARAWGGSDLGTIDLSKNTGVNFVRFYGTKPSSGSPTYYDVDKIVIDARIQL